MPGWAHGQERWSERSQPCPTTPRGMPGTVRSGLEIRSDGDGRIGCWLSGPAGLSPDPRAARSGVSARPPGGGGVLEWSDSEPGDGCVLRGFPAGSHRWLTVLPEFRSLPSLTCQTSSISMLERQLFRRIFAVNFIWKDVCRSCLGPGSGTVANCCVVLDGADA